MTMTKEEIAYCAVKALEKTKLLGNVIKGLSILLALALAYIAYLSYALWLCMP